MEYSCQTKFLYSKIPGIKGYFTMLKSLQKFDKNERFHNACRDAGLSSTQEHEFSHYLHDSGQNEERMAYQEIRIEL